MRGHEAIIAMRNAGKRPAIVYLDTMRDTSTLKAWQDWPNVSPAIATVWIQPDDVPHRLDLRFLVGMVVVVTGADSMRVRAVEWAALEAKAERVIAAEVQPDIEPLNPWKVADLRETRVDGRKVA